MKIERNNEWQARKLLVNFFYILHDVSPFDCVFFFTLLTYSCLLIFWAVSNKTFYKQTVLKYKLKSTIPGGNHLNKVLLFWWLTFANFVSIVLRFVSVHSFLLVWLSVEHQTFLCNPAGRKKNTNVKTWLIWTIPTNTNERTLKGSIGTVSKKDLVDNGDIRLDNLMMTSAKTVKLYK